MNVNIYYGGRGLVDDPTIVVINRIQEVLEELNVHVTRYNLYEIKNTITTLSQSVVEADGVVFATTVEWVGMGGYMQTLLDSCWLYADKSRTSSTYMFPVVMSRAYGEREVVTALSNSWEIIGGVVGESLSAYVDDTTDFEFNNEYKEIIEKYAENIYRTISKGLRNLPSSSQTIRKNVIKEVVNSTPIVNAIFPSSTIASILGMRFVSRIYLFICATLSPTCLARSSLLFIMECSSTTSLALFPELSTLPSPSVSHFGPA